MNGIQVWSLHKNSFQLVDKLSGLSIHLFDRDAGMPDLDVTVGEQTLGNVGVGVHNVTELDLLLSELLLVLL